MNRHLTAATIVAALAAFALSACATDSGVQPPAGTPVAGGTQIPLGLGPIGGRAGGKIQHVVIIVQENRSVDNLFQGYPGADTQPYGYSSTGQKVTLQPVGLEAPWDIDHSSQGFFAACDGQGSL